MVKVTFTQERPSRPKRGVDVSFTLSLARILDEVGGQRHVPPALPPRITRYPLCRGAGWAPGPGWTSVESLSLHRDVKTSHKRAHMAATGGLAQ